MFYTIVAKKFLKSEIKGGGGVWNLPKILNLQTGFLDLPMFPTTISSLRVPLIMETGLLIKQNG